MSIIDEFNEKFKIKEYTIFETDFWVWSLRPAQGTVGAGVLSLKRECPVLSEVTEQEFKDLEKMIKKIEQTLAETFQYDVMNYLMLMMVDKHVHYHVFPRYEGIVKLGDHVYSDNNWPKPPELGGEALSPEEISSILNEIKRNLSV